MSGTERPLRILFIGNSLIYYNDMPSIFAHLCEAAHIPAFVDSVTKPAGTLAEFADRSNEIGPKAYGKLIAEPWDFVILEPSRRVTPDENTVKNAEFSAAVRLHALASAAGARVVLYAVFGNNNGIMKVTELSGTSDYVHVSQHPVTRYDHTKWMHEVSAQISEKLGGVAVAEAGYAFENYFASGGPAELYKTDELHPTAAGSYLAACVIFGAVFGKACSDVAFDSGLSAAEAKRLRLIADKTVFDGLVP